MDRRKFLQALGLGGVVLSLNNRAFANRPKTSNLLITAYYFRAHMYTIVPKQVAADIRAIAEMGANAIAIALLEQDLFVAVENVKIISEEARKQNLKVFCVPSRWAGLVAGAPKVPSLFAVQNPETWAYNPDGKPQFNNTWGITCSVFHPETRKYFTEQLLKSQKLFGFDGFIFDEPKCLTTDYSKAATEKQSGKVTWDGHMAGVVDFFSEVTGQIKQANPKLVTSLFNYASANNAVAEWFAKITHLDYYGMDGRPWPNNWGGELEGSNKTIHDNYERFNKLAVDNGKRTLYLIENHNLRAEDTELMRRGLDLMLNFLPQHLIFYYYPRNVGKPEESMRVISKFVRSIK